MKKKRHVWVIEWLINVWEPRHAYPGWTKPDVLGELRKYKEANPGAEYRLAKYVRQEPK